MQTQDERMKRCRICFEEFNTYNEYYHHMDWCHKDKGEL